MKNFTSRLSFSAIIAQLKNTWKVIVLGIVVSLGGAGFTVLIATLTDNPIWKLAKDPAEVTKVQPYIGMLSNWGVLLWVITGTVCVFSAVLLKQFNAPSASYRFIAVSGALSLLLGIDDLYMFHERLLPRMFHIPEFFYYVLYLLTFLTYLAYFARQILKYDYLLFAAALFLFGLSRDYFIQIPYFGDFVTTEDMLKYFGIVFWLIFFFRTSLQEVIELFHAKNWAMI